jgi:hypothetical protein
MATFEDCFPPKKSFPLFCGQVGADLATKIDKPWHAQSLRNTICGTAAIEAQKMLKQKKLFFYNFDQAL